MLCLFTTCLRDEYPEPFEENQESEVDRFFASRLVASRSTEYTGAAIGFISSTLREDECIAEQVAAFKAEYGLPLWDDAVLITGETSWKLCVPVYNAGVEDEINTIWAFESTGDTLYNRVLERDPAARYVEEYWRYDYFTTEALHREPRSGLKFGPSSRTVPALKCVHAYVEFKFAEIVEIADMGFHCWEDDLNVRMLAPADGGLSSDDMIIPPSVPAMDNTGIPGAGSSSSVYTDNSFPFIEDLTKDAEKLDEESKEKLEETLKDAMELCPTDKLVGYMKSQGYYLSEVSLNPSFPNGASAAYNSDNDVLQFRSTEDINFGSVMHEYIHFIQSKLTSGILDNTNRGPREIERMIFFDLLKLYIKTNYPDSDEAFRKYLTHIEISLNAELPDDLQEEYDDWLEATYQKMVEGNPIEDITPDFILRWGKEYAETTRNYEYKYYDYTTLNGYGLVLPQMFDIIKSCIEEKKPKVHVGNRGTGSNSFEGNTTGGVTFGGKDNGKLGTGGVWI